MPTSYMNHKDYIRKQMPKLLLTSSLKVSLFFYFIPPKVGVKSKLLAIGQYKRTKPDIDNLIKLYWMRTIDCGKTIIKL